ncbi:hypothetical protein GUY60_13265, partial [Streptomyces sp. YC537]|nr:hypothetical protein [Streptomyces boluensis]
GSGAKGKKQASKAAPDLSGGSPEEGLATASNLKPHQAVEAMDSVGGAVDKDVGKEHKQLASKPPAMDRPTGAPKTLHGDPKSDEAAKYNEDKASKAEDAKDDKAEVKGEKKPEGKIEAEEMEEPDFFDQVGMMAGYALGWVGEKVGLDCSAEDLAAQFAGMPTKDEAMKQAQNGTAPGVEMKGQADEKSEEQGGNTDDKSQEAAETGADDAGRKMGEDQVYPDAPSERLEGKVPKEGGKSRVGGGGANTGAVPPEAASEVAEHERKPQFKKALTDGRQDMGKGREKKDQDNRKSKEKHKRQVDKEVQSNTKQQTGKREGALTDVDKQREDWTKEQDDELKKLGTKKSDRETKIREDVKKEEEDTDKNVGKEKETSDKDVKDKGKKAEEDAEKKKDEKTDDSKNWLSKALDWIKDQFKKLRDKIVEIIKAARDAIIGALKKFKETVEGWINAARKGIVEMIKKFIEDLIEFVTSLVEAVIEIARRIRKFITDLIKAALAFVTKLANALKQIMKDLLESIAKLLSDVLNVLKKMLLDVLKACKEALKAVLDFATKFISAFGEFMMILVDILSDPGGWLSGAKNSAYDGAKNHLFNEVKNAVKQWFNDKVKEITGLTEAVWNKLMKGGWTIEKIAKEVWDAIVPQLPFIIGEIVITKVLAKLIPGAGWGAAILEAIQAAIGSLGEILKAIGAVITWLKSVRQGGAGVLFAKAIAAGIVVLLEMAYELILSGIGKYVSKVGKRLKGVAAGLGKDKGPGGDKGKDGGGDPPNTNKDKGADGDKGTTPSSTPPKTQTTSTTTPPPGKPKGQDGPGKPKDQGAPAKPKDQGAPSKPKDQDAPGKPKDQDGPAKPKNNDGQAPPKPKDKDTQSPSPKPPKPKGPTNKNDKDNGKDNDKPGGKNNTPSDKSTKPTPPTSKDKNGNPKNENTNDKKDTEPTPSPKPSTPTPKPGKTDGPDGPKKDTTNDNKNQDPNGNKDKKDTSDSDSKKDSDGSNKKDNDGSGKKDKTDSDGKGKKDGNNSSNNGRKDTDGGKDKHDPGRPKNDEAKDDRRKEEESEESKQAQLNRILARIRAQLTPKVEDGMWESTMEGTLKGMKAWYRLKSLNLIGDDQVKVWGRLNPAGSALEALREQSRKRDEIVFERSKKNKLPPPIFPPFGTGQVPKLTEAKYLSRNVDYTGSEPRDSYSWPDGWGYITSHNMTEKTSKSQWVRMHLLPESIGGLASNNNLVPARIATNNEMRDGVERKAYDEIKDSDKVIWYESEVTLHAPQNDENGVLREGFPESITSRYGMYEHVRGTGKKQDDWDREKKHVKEYPIKGIPLPTPDEHSKLIINSAGAKSIWTLLGGPDSGFSMQIPRYIAGMDGNGKTHSTPPPKYRKVDDIKDYLDLRKLDMLPGAMPDLSRVIAKLRTIDKDGLIDWLK